MKRRRLDPLFLLALLVGVGAPATSLTQELLDHPPTPVVITASVR